MSKYLRSFIALYPDPTARAHIAQFISCMRERNSSCRWEDPDKVHITLKFLGDVLPATLDAITVDLEKEIVAEGVISAQIDMVGAFPGMQRPRIVWLGFTDPVAKVRTLQQLIENVAERHGLLREQKRFTAHFTVGRVKRDARTEGLENEIEACSFQPATVHFSAVRIMESTLTPKGAIHTERARISLIPEN
jgi:2'-5' RNA ligase